MVDESVERSRDEIQNRTCLSDRDGIAAYPRPAVGGVGYCHRYASRFSGSWPVRRGSPGSACLKFGWVTLGNSNRTGCLPHRRCVARRRHYLAEARQKIGCMIMKRWTKISLGLGCALVLPPLAFFFWLTVLDCFPLNVMWSNRTSHESKQLLLAARTTNELAQAVGQLGHFLSYPDHSWVAIRYRDTHSGMLASSAVVRDSGDAWFESTVHYCGAFSGGMHNIYRILEMDRELRELGETNSPANTRSGHDLEILNLVTATNLAAARKNLEAMGFKRIEAPSSP